MQTEYSNDALTISCNDHSNHQLAWNIGEPVDFDPTTYTAPSLANQGENCDDEENTIINTYTGNAADIYSHVAFDYFAFGAEGTPTGPSSNEDANVDYCGYEGSVEEYCLELYDLLADLDVRPVAELVDDIGDLSDLRSSALLTHQAIRSLMGKGEMDSVVYLLEQLNSDYDLPLLFNYQLEQQEIADCNSLITILPNQTDAEKSWKKMAKLLLERDTLQQSATDINSQQMQKLQQILSFNNWVTPRAQALTDAHDFSMHAVYAQESDTTVLRKPDTSANSLEWMVYPNPVTNVLYIKSRSGQMEQIEIYGLDGRCVLSDNSNQGRQYAILDVSTLPAGIYMIYHTQTAGTTYISSFVKQ